VTGKEERVKGEGEGEGEGGACALRISMFGRKMRMRVLQIGSTGITW
jgi:hypothetical protein